jgi:hypothetical protein
MEPYLKGAHLKKDYPGKTDMEMYNIALEVLPEAGYQVTKEKKLSGAIAGDFRYQGKQVFWGLLVNIMGDSLIITVKSKSLEKDVLLGIAESIGDVLDKALK